jgi:protein-tyrosine phosphatase
MTSTEGPGDRPTGGRIRSVLVVCSANQCRSPMAAALLARELARRDPDVRVTSAGVLADDGSPATAGTIKAARSLDVDLRGHRSRAATGAVVAGSDLILGMERMHLREAVVLDPLAFSRAFTLKELVRRGEEHGIRAAGESQVAWLAAVHEGRRAAALMGASDDDDVADPTADLRVDHDTMAAEVEDLVLRAVDLLWPPGVA